MIQTLICLLPLAVPPAPSADWWPQAPRLPEPTGSVLRVSSVEELFAAADTIPRDGTLLLADGHYRMPRYLELRTDGVTLRSASGNRHQVVLDGARSRHGELLGISAAEGVTIADLTICNVRWNGFKINSQTGVQRLTIRNCVIHNVWQRGIKGVGVPEKERERLRPRDCRIEYCLFYNDRPKQFSDDPADTAENFRGNYLGGIDVMYASGWTISDNVFIGIRGRTGEARGAVFLWHDARDCVVERNLIVDCDTGICLGNSHRKPETQIHGTRCVVRNNLVTRCHETGILADYTRDCSILHNTIHDPESRLKRLIRLVHDNHGLTVANNLLSGPTMRRSEATGRMEISGNLTGAFGKWFSDPASGNLHLSPQARSVVQRVPKLPQVTRDFDGRIRRARTPVGADDGGDRISNKK